MKNKEQQKLFTQAVRATAKSHKWKFRSNFAYILKDDFFYESTFYFDPKQDFVFARLSFKPISLDHTFWEIAKMPEDEKPALSIHANGAFTVTSCPIKEYSLDFKDISKVKNVVSELFEKIVEDGISMSDTILNVDQYFIHLENSIYRLPLSKIFCLIELGEFKKAIKKINNFRNDDIDSGFRFEGIDFYDIVEEYCNNKLGIQDSAHTK
ncbi:MAG: hypothetical protein JKY52_07840 [Flavobacteriales bacterium]|nr:hypothetical protein [Flavobacteriales bacterium]